MSLNRTISVDERTIEPAPPIVALAVCGLGHFVVDGICAAMIVSGPGAGTMTPTVAWCVVMAYHLVAFGAQPLVGFGTDRWGSPRLAAALGCGIAACGVILFQHLPIAAICVVGLGNAVFHVGSGAIGLNATPGRALGAGIVVAPGAIGLAFGGLLARNGFPVGWAFAALLLGLCVMFLKIGTPAPADRRATPARPVEPIEAVVGLLGFAIAVRSLVGLMVVSPWRPEPVMGWILTCAAAGGKVGGGVLADRFGWLRVTTVAMILATPLAPLGITTSWLVVPGVFLVQMAMPVTVAAISRLFPGRPAFSFGLASLALLIGSLGVLTGLEPVLSNRWVMFGLLLASTGALFQGLRLTRATTRQQA
jgi:MFS transporter, FSR family, fosmidomycin resistance protein